MPTLQPSDVVIMDNLGSHKVGGVREAVEARGASLVYLPPYSPDLNPIEQAFAELKGTPRRIAVRTMSRLWDALATCSLASRSRNAPTISPAPAMFQADQWSDSRRIAAAMAGCGCGIGGRAS